MALWTARLIGALTVLFLALDAIGKFARPHYVVDAFARLEIPIALAPLIGALLLALVVLYTSARTRLLASVLLTGYLGGAVAVNLRAGDPVFETVFPVIVGVFVWAPSLLTEVRLRPLLPWRREL
jgi:hypothetical protein